MSVLSAPAGEGRGLDKRLSRDATRDRLRDEIEELHAIIDLLKGALASESPGHRLIEPQPWMRGLSRQERALVGALFARSPRPISLWDLLDLLPGHDRVEERQVQIVPVLVMRVRNKLGRDVISNERGEGYFMTAAARDHLLAIP